MRIPTLLLPLTGALLCAQFSHGTLEANLAALGCDTVLVAPKQRVVDPIHWSPDSKAIGVKIDGKWVRIDLDRLLLKRLKWRDNQDVAAPTGKPEFAPLAEPERVSWIAADEEGARSVTFFNGVKVELAEVLPVGAALQLTYPDGQTRVRWRTTQEDCTALTPSPNGLWVAYLCGIHGVAVMRVPVPPRLPKSTAPVK